MKKLSILLILFTLLCSHEFWLNPNKFVYQTGELINIKFLVGENFEGANWSENKNSAQSLELFLDGATDDMAQHLSDSTGDSLRLAIYDEGTFMVNYLSTNKYIELEPAKFLEYLKEDGLTNAIEFRTAHKEEDSIGREYYQRSAKTIFQVGDKRNSVFKKNSHLPLDITPVQNPYDSTLGKGENISVRILFKNKPLASQLIKIWHRYNNQTEKIELVSDENGLIQFPFTRTGKWMVSTVKMERLENDPKAQWKSTWGSCTWGE
jgi:uncharacterized GH25 family protein